MKNRNKQKAGRARWTAHPWTPPANRATIHRMYHTQRMTQFEIAKSLGVGTKAVETAMKKFKIPRRSTARRCQIGPLNTAWKGKDAGYQAKHLRIATLKGKPKKCEVCGATNPSKTYDWANLSGDYDNPSDYLRMCRSCHRRYDNARR